jgi:transposase
VAVTIGPANIHEGTKLIPLVESISIETGRGRPRKRPRTVYADTKYATPLNRFYLDKKQIRSQIPDPPNKTRKMPGRPRRFDRETYHGVRYNVERFFGWLENYRKIAVRYERIPKMFLALIYLACILILWRVLK